MNLVIKCKVPAERWLLPPTCACVCVSVRIAGLTARPRVSGILEKKALCKTEDIEVFARGVCVSV